jgi:two-component system LytT family response regulator
MTKYKVIIIDDEKPAREIIKLFLQKHPSITIEAEAENGFEGLKLINEIKPDLLFLDIQMPKLTGFELLELIPNPPVVIFSTAYDEYALKAFERNAVDYLLKPFNQKRFDESIKKGIEKISNRTNKPSIKTVIEDSSTSPINRVVVKDGTNIHIIPTTEIIRISAQDDYSEIITNKGKYLKLQTMKHFEHSLDATKFIRVHRSSIIQVSEIVKIDKYGKETHMARLKNGDEIVVSANGYAKLKELLGW